MDLSDAPGMGPEDAVLSLFSTESPVAREDAIEEAGERWGMPEATAEQAIENLVADQFLQGVKDSLTGEGGLIETDRPADHPSRADEPWELDPSQEGR